MAPKYLQKVPSFTFMEASDIVAAMKIVDFLSLHPVVSASKTSSSGIGGLSLSTILKKVASKSYHNFSEFTDDLEKLWKSMDELTNINPHYPDVAKYCRSLTIKALNKYQRMTAQKWSEKVVDMRAKIWDRFGEAPPTVSGAFPGLAQKNFVVRNAEGISEKDIFNFLCAMEMSNSSEDHREMIRILNKLQPEIEAASADISIDVNSLKAETFRELEKYLRGAIEKRGQAYPS